MTQARVIIDALTSTGKGIKIENPIFVISISHEYFLLNVLGYMFAGEQRLIGQCDYLLLEKNEDEIEGLYFDVSACLNAGSKMLEELK